MMKRQLVAAVMAAALAAPASLLAAAQTVTISGTGKNEAKKPYTDYSTRGRDVQTGTTTTPVPLDQNGNFSLTGLPVANYIVELVDRNGKVVCSEGPFNMTQQTVKDHVNISCHHPPAAWWLLGAAGAAGITAGVVAAANASAAQ